MAKRILVTRPDKQSANLCRLIKLQGWQAIKFPVIKTQSKSLSEKEYLCLKHIDQYQYVFFISANAVNYAHEILAENFKLLQQVKCIAVGLATYKQLSQYAINNILLPINGFNSEGILALPELLDLSGSSCLIVRGVGGRELLANTLRNRGASVEYVGVYTREAVAYNRELVNSILFVDTIDAVLIYSVEALTNLLKIVEEVNNKNNLLLIPLVVISQRVYAVAKEIGFTKVIIASKATDAEMINALINGENCGGSN